MRTTLSSRLAAGLWPETARATCDGQLLVGGVDLADLAAQFGTPVLAIDAADVRSRCRAYREALPGVEIAYAAKAFLCLYRVAAVKHGVHRTFVAVDGGMSDNPRPALYGARYPVRRFGRPERVRSVP